MADQAIGFLGFNLAVPYLHADRFPAIKTHRINFNCLAGKKPADRQRFKGSLSEPFLLTIDGYSVIGRQVVEWRKRNNIVGLWIKPPRKTDG